MESVANTSSTHRSAINPHRHYVLLLLLLVGICSWSDRQVFSILLEAIRKDFTLSDTQLGFLGGTAFALFYIVAALPIAWLADRGNRRNIISLAVFLWSIVTAATSATVGYGSIFLCRMGVGIGEAGSSAASQSMVADLYPPPQRALAMAIMFSYMPIGYLVSYSLGGLLNDSIGWRTAFLVFGIPGIALAALVRFTVREPPRGTLDAKPTVAGPDHGSLLQTIAALMRLKGMWHICFGGAAHGLGLYAIAVWLPAFFMRVYGMSSTQVGLRLALILGLGGLIGTLAGGRIADRIVTRTRNASWYLWTCTSALVVSVPLTTSVYAGHGAGAAFMLLTIPIALNHMVSGPAAVAIQVFAGVRQRALAAALFLFMKNLVAAGLGPLLIGALSDSMHARFGPESLRYALLIVAPTTAAWAALHFYFAGRALRDRLPQCAI